MVRQCAWCLRLMDISGQRTSVLPVPKIYEASHGMCKECAQRWLKDALQALENESLPLPLPMRAEVSYSC
jgi:hypothetical protein